MSNASNLNISGFSDPKANGIYHYNGILNGYACYLSENNYLLAYYPQYMPFTLESGYFIIGMSITSNSAPVFVPKYYNESNDIFSKTWLGFQSSISGEQDTNLETMDYMSTSSNSSNSSSSNSSSSNSSSTSSSNSSSTRSSGSSNSSQSSNSSSSSESALFIGNMTVGDTFIVFPS